MEQTILFVCPHGAGKSRMAAAYFNQLAPAGWRATSAGQEPQETLGTNAIRLLTGTAAEPYLDRELPRPIAAVETPAPDRRHRLRRAGGRPVDARQPAVRRRDARGDLRAGRNPRAHPAPIMSGQEAPPLSGAAELPLAASAASTGVGLGPLAAYFLRLGALGFGGPAALVGFMHRDLVEERRWLTEEDYQLAMALAQLMPGPLAAQCAIAIGYLLRGVAGATAIGLAFILPSFAMVLGLSVLYVAYGGLWWMQALFYGVGAAVIGIIVISAYKLARGTNKRDPLLWGIFAVLLVLTVVTQTELALAFILAGLLALVAKAPPRRLKSRVPFLSLAPWFMLAPAAPLALGLSGGLLLTIFLFFVKAGSFVFGSGLAIVPFLYEGVVREHGWLTEQQFPRRRRRCDDHARPGGDHGRLHRLPGRGLRRGRGRRRRDVPACLPPDRHPRPLGQAAPRPAPAQGLRARRDRRGDRGDRGGGDRAWLPRHRRHPDRADRPGEPGDTLAVQGARAPRRRGGRGDRPDHLGADARRGRLTLRGRAPKPVRTGAPSSSERYVCDTPSMTAATRDAG